MLHSRTHKIEDVPDADDLARKLTDRTYPTDQGFRFQGYLWLNDSRNERDIQEYAVVRERDGLHVSSFVVSMNGCFASLRDDGDHGGVSPSKLARTIVAASSGGFDDGPFARRGMFVGIETSEQRLVKAAATASLAEPVYAGQWDGNPPPSTVTVRAEDIRVTIGGNGIDLSHFPSSGTYLVIRRSDQESQKHQWKTAKAVGYRPDGEPIEFEVASIDDGAWYPKGSDEARRATVWAHLVEDPSVVLWDRRPVPPADVGVVPGPPDIEDGEHDSGASDCERNRYR